MTKIDPMTRLRPAEASRYLRERWVLVYTPATLSAYRYRGFGPAYRKDTSRRVLYDAADLDAWAATRVGPKHVSTSELAAP